MLIENPIRQFIYKSTVYRMGLRLLIPFFLFLLSGPVLGQTSVGGKIFSDGKPVAGATVTLNKKSMLSGKDGRFLFTGLQGTTFRLSVTAVGHEPLQQAVDSTTPFPDSLVLNLTPASGSMEEVVVSGTLKPVQKLRSPVAVEVYSPQFFKKNPTPSIFESLSMVNGVRPQINCSVCNTGDIHINGLEGPYTMVTIDGMPIVSALASVYGLFGIPNGLIERVEIVKGPASGLYGSEAIGGLINIITKSPQKAPQLSVNLMSTSWLEHSADLGLRWKSGKKSTALTGVHYFNYQNPTDRNQDGFTDVTLQHRVSVFQKWQWNRKEDRAASLAARFFRENRWGGQTGWKRSQRGSDEVYAESIDTRRWELIGNYQLPVRERMFFNFSATDHDQNSYYGATPYMGRQKILFGQLTWDKNLSASHTLLTGLAGRYNYYDDNSTATTDTVTLKNAPEKRFIPGLFLQDEWTAGPDHLILLGLRVDHHPVHKFIVTPRAAYKWNLSSSEVIRLNAGTGFRVVNLFTEEHSALTGARAVEILEALKPEQSYNVNLNYSVQFGKPSRRFGIDASAWYTYFHNQILADYDTDPNKIIYRNLNGHAISRGFTLNLEGNLLQRLKGMAGITLQDVAKVEEEGGKSVKVRPVLTESWSGTWSLTYTLPVQGLTFDYTGSIYGPMRLPHLGGLDPRPTNSPVWSLQNLQVTKWFSARWEAYLGVKNLLNWTPAKKLPFLIARANDPFDKNVVYNADGSVQPTAENPYGLTFDPTYIYAPNQGRRGFLGVKFTLQ